MTPPSRRSSRTRILDDGLDLMSRVGVEGLTLGVLAEETGLSKSGLFAHFRSKTAVQLSLLRHMADRAEAQVVRPALEEPPGLGRLRTLVSGWFGWSRKAGLTGGCPVAGALFELDDDGDEEVRAAVEAMESRWRGLLAQTVQMAVDAGELRADLDVDQLVFELCGVYLTHHASDRFLKDPLADQRAQRAFEALIARSRTADLS